MNIIPNSLYNFINNNIIFKLIIYCLNYKKRYEKKIIPLK